MKWLGPVLLVGIFARHNLSWTLPGYNPQAWFYMLGGMLEILLCSILLLTLPAQPLIKAAMWIGILEGGQLAVCRLATLDIASVPKNVNLCDHLTNLPIGATMTALYLGIICWAIGKNWRSASRS